MTATILCFGDSNTHGADAATGTRHPKAVRWPGVMAEALGEGFDVVEEGLGGRTTMWDDPYSPGRNGSTYLGPCLDSHAPLDLVILMLGTNDLKGRFHLAAEDIARGMYVLAETVLRSGCGPDGTAPAVLVVAPVPIGELTAMSEFWGYREARDASRRLAAYYELAASSLGCAFFDAGSVAETSPADGVHLDAAAHRSLGLALAERVRGLLAGRPGTGRR